MDQTLLSEVKRPRSNPKVAKWLTEVHEYVWLLELYHQYEGSL